MITVAEMITPLMLCYGHSWLYLHFLHILCVCHPEVSLKALGFYRLSHLFVCSFRYCCYDISWMAWTILIKLTGNIHWPRTSNIKVIPWFKYVVVDSSTSTLVVEVHLLVHISWGVWQWIYKAKWLAFLAGFSAVSFLWCCRLGDTNSTQCVKCQCHLSIKFVFWNTGRKRTEANWITEVHLENHH